MIGVAMANYAAPQQNGRPAAYDAIAYDEHGAAKENLLIEAGDREGVYLAAFDVAKIREYRKAEVWGHAFRKPHSYRLLAQST
jgi:predicted amidohydrolase